MAEEEDSRTEAVALRHRFQDLISELKRSPESPLDASNRFCQDFCQVLMNEGHQRKADADSLYLLEMYTVAIVCYAEAVPFLCPQCEHTTDVLDKLSWTCLNLLLSFSEPIPGALWEEFQSSVTVADGILQAHGNSQLHTLAALVEENGVWSNVTLCSLLSDNMPDEEKVHEFLAREGPELLHMRVKHLIKQKRVQNAARLAKTCAEFPLFEGRKNFKQIYLVCLCEIKSQQEFMQEIKEIDCKDALDMICNLESEEDEKGALSLCTAFLKRQLLTGDVYCAWELTLFWSKLLIRLESKQAFLEQCRLLARHSGSVYHILLLIKVVQAEIDKDGLAVCIEMCIQALKMEVHDSEDCNISICKTISCLLPLDLEVKRACQLTEFLVKPSVDSYYAVETVFNEPDQKLDEEDPLILNSLRCDLLLALKTKWPFDPEFWDWKTLKRHCVALMGEEAASILSADKLTDSEDNETEVPDVQLTLLTDELSKVETERKKKREMKKLRERGFVSARFRNWQAYMQYCVLCDKEFLGHRIVKHALKHVQDGIFRCPICAEKFQTREILEPHVTSHVKQSCKERLAAMNASTKSPSFHTKFRSGSGMLNKQKHYIKTSQVSQGATVCSNNLDPSNCGPGTNSKDKIKSSSPRQSHPIRDVNNSKDCSCPVASCQKVFKYFRNLVAHVRAHRDEQEAVHFLKVQSQKAMCQYCHRQFVNLTHLNDHLQMHCGEKPYFCIQLGCNCSFASHAELLVHRKMHAEFQAQCTYPNCERIFNETYLLYDHEAQHYITFSCKTHNCGKVFYTQSELDLHQQEHTKQDLPAVDEEPHSQAELAAQMPLALEQPPSQMKEVFQEPSLVNIKCLVNSMLNLSQGSTAYPEHPALSESENVSQTSASHDPDASHGLQSRPEGAEQMKRFESCFVKLKPILINPDDPLFLNALKNSDSETQTLLKDKKLFCVPQNQPEHSTPKSSSPLPGTEAKKEKILAYVCPFESCTRKYSTSKSLSRHVKNVHAEAFEEWKLSKKYKRIAEIAARKSLSKHTSTPSQMMKKWINNSRQTPQPGEGIQPKTSLETMILSSPSVLPGYDSLQPVSVKLTSQLEGTQSNASPNQSGLMQVPLSQTWTTPAVDDISSGFYAQKHFTPMTLSDNQQTNPLYHPDPILDYASASVYDGTSPLSVNIHTPSSVMNEASKYVSSSLRVLHALTGDQTCDLSQVESASVDLGYSDTGHNHPKEIPISTSLLHTESLPEQNISPCFSAFPSSASPTSVQSLENSNKDISTDALFSSDIKCMSNLETPDFKKQSEDFSVPVCSAVPQTNEKHSGDVCNDEMSQRVTEGLSSDEPILSGSVETNQTKKIKSSKRTKWPAIIQAGKVICCRCYREFSSTKSLGGHLSKRSKCKPVDEIDLTADLPASFLDFLNDPGISTVQMPLPTNNIHDQTHEPFIYPSSESSVFTENRPPSLHGTNCGIQNPNVPSQEPLEIIQNSSFCHPPVQETETNSAANFTPANNSEDGKIVEIERALQRLDLVDILNREPCAPESTDLQSVVSLNTDIKMDPCHTSKDEVENKQKCILKPFRCKEDCVYGAMTKEALFKHLCKVHNYSEDKINELKKNPDKLAPYSCHLCAKKFTRTTGLKIHYKNVHRYSKEEMACLKIGFRKTRKSSGESKEVQFSSVIKQGNDLSEQNQHQIDPKLTMKSIDSNVKQVRAVGVAAKKTKFPTQDAFSTESHNAADVSQRTSVNLEGISAAHANKLHVSSPAAVKQEPPQEPSAGSLFCTMNAPDKITKDAIIQFNGKTETKSDKAVVLQDTNNTAVNNIDSGDLSDKLSLYRPYRCVHEGCVAAFSIQQNLILHYRAMHQSENNETSGGTSKADGSVQVQEYKCQVKQCSKVVSKVTSLLKHYLLLHKCTLEKASALLSGVKVGTFQCDQSKCSAHFTCHLKYIDHIKNDHKAIKVSADGDFESVDLTFKCQFEGCGRVYTTKSNLLRHLMKKHHTTFETLKEQNILKHYSTHGLTERYIEDQRNQFLLCKKSKEIMSEKNSKDEEMEQIELGDQTESSKVSSEIVGPEMNSATNVIVNESFTATSGIKRKRGRPRKSERRNKICLERKLSLRKGVKCMLEVSGSILNHQENHVGDEVALKLYRPSEFEASILKFNEDSTNLSNWTSKPQQTQLTPAVSERDEVQCIVNFRNPLKLETVKNVKIVIYKNVSTSSDLLKQLQDMQPMVILKKWLHS